MVALISSTRQRNDLFRCEQHEAFVSHKPVPREHKLKDENRNLFEIGGAPSEVRIIESVFYLGLGSRPQMVANKVRVKRAQKIQGPNCPVLHLRVTLLGLICFLWLPFDNILLLRVGFLPTHNVHLNRVKLTHNHVFVLEKDLLLLVTHFDVCNEGARVAIYFTFKLFILKFLLQNIFTEFAKIPKIAPSVPATFCPELAHSPASYRVTSQGWSSYQSTEGWDPGTESGVLIRRKRRYSVRWLKYKYFLSHPNNFQ